MMPTTVVSAATMMAASTAVMSTTAAATVCAAAAFTETLHDRNGTTLYSTIATFWSRQRVSSPLSSATRARSLPKAAAWRRAQKSNLIPEGTDRVATGGAPTRSLLSNGGRRQSRTANPKVPRCSRPVAHH
jgi:hypothetical protein